MRPLNLIGSVLAISSVLALVGASGAGATTPSVLVTPSALATVHSAPGDWLNDDERGSNHGEVSIATPGLAAGPALELHTCLFIGQTSATQSTTTFTIVAAAPALAPSAAQVRGYVSAALALLLAGGLVLLLSRLPGGARRHK
ncbi:hypothetical protein BH11ACT4_BH11ACT4_17330 [soil metagenome]